MSEIHDIKVDVNDSSAVQNENQKFSKKSTRYSWALSEVSKCLCFPRSEVYSSKFKFQNYTWRLILNTISKDNHLEEISVALSKAKNEGLGHNVLHKITLYAGEGSYFASAKPIVSQDDSVNVRSIVNYDTHKEFLDAVLKCDLLTVRCDISVLNTVPCKDRVIPKTSPKGSNLPRHPYPDSGRVYRRVHINDRYHQFIMMMALFTLFLMMVFTAFTEHRFQHDQDNFKQINDFVIGTTLKVINIAEVMNLTEIKAKSLDLLHSMGKHYNVSTLEFSKEKFQDILDKL